MKTFRIGGVHPRENKITAGQPIVAAPLPQQAIILLSQHIGAPAQCVVEKGDSVKVGTLLAKANGFVSANIHSPVSGTIAKIDTIADGSGYQKPAIYINVEGDEWEESIDRSETLVTSCNMSAQAIIDKIDQMGIVGIGGATFPTKVKLMPPPNMKPEVLIINAVECEPYLTNDHALMLAKADEIIVGIEILMKAINVDRTFIGIEANKPDAIELFKQKTQERKDIEVVRLQCRYPQGGEKQLIDAVIGRQVASGALPVSTGAIVQNVATAYAVYEAVQKNKPLIERVVTVTGKSLTKPGNYLARMGMPVSQLIEVAGGMPEDTGKIVLGGPMMGRATANIDTPTGKGTSGILVIPEHEAHRQEPSPCIRCAKCVAACPMGLEPYLLSKAVAIGNLEIAEERNIYDCIECGCCSYSCPAHRPLLDYIRQGKGKVMAIMRARATEKK
ncbi:MAG: electron transport complex subunit RsxC [Muribaculaceae bacterium]|nr:electron transport complex subunit RsxC [Muribaculaceae bacterium]